MKTKLTTKDFRAYLNHLGYHSRIVKCSDFRFLQIYKNGFKVNNVSVYTLDFLIEHKEYLDFMQKYEIFKEENLLTFS